MMQKDASRILQAPYIDSFEAINGVKFTPRELDILACLVNGRSAKTTANLLSISPKTVEAHTRNIMGKLGCNSRESIIDFTEKSGVFPRFRKRYQNLLLQAKFEELLQKVSIQIRQEKITCYIIDKRHYKADPRLLDRLTKDLAHAGIQRVGDKPDHTIVISDIEREEFQDKQPLVFNAQENYYCSVFEVLKALLPVIDLDKLIAGFMSYDETSSHDLIYIYGLVSKKGYSKRR